MNIAPASHWSSFPIMLLAGSSLLMVGMVLHIGLGKVPLSPSEVVLALAGTPVEEYHYQIVWNMRLPRTLIGALAGAMLGLAGAILQSITRNPLAEPGLTGVSAGCVLFVAGWTIYGPAQYGTGVYMLSAAILGGLCAGAVVYGLYRCGRQEAMRLALIGVLVGSVLQACVSMLLLRHSQTYGTIMLWNIGSLNGRSWPHWELVWPWATVVIPLGMLAAGWLNALTLGDEAASGLGLRIQRTRLALFTVAVLLTAGAVSVAGAIGFIGLIGPHIARKLTGEDARRLLPLSALTAAALLVAADIVSQTITFSALFPENHNRAGMPVGAVTAMLGVPFFLHLLRKK